MYATADDIELRYPGELAQAGPRDAAGNLRADAIAAALAAAEAVAEGSDGADGAEGDGAEGAEDGGNDDSDDAAGGVTGPDLTEGGSRS